MLSYTLFAQLVFNKTFNHTDQRTRKKMKLNEAKEIYATIDKVHLKNFQFEFSLSL